MEKLTRRLRNAPLAHHDRPVEPDQPQRGGEAGAEGQLAAFESPAAQAGRHQMPGQGAGRG